MHTNQTDTVKVIAINVLCSRRPTTKPGASAWCTTETSELKPFYVQIQANWELWEVWELWVTESQTNPC